MNERARGTKIDRREFLRRVLAASGAAGAGLALGSAPAYAATKPIDTCRTEHRGYRETEHVRQYYAKAAI